MNDTSMPARPGEDHDRLLARVLEVQARLAFPVTSRAMFGGTMVYADGRPLASLSTAGLAVKLAPADRAEVVHLGGVPLSYGPGKPRSRHYVVLPPRIVHDDDSLAEWLTRAGHHVASLPTSRT